MVSTDVLILIGAVASLTALWVFSRRGNWRRRRNDSGDGTSADSGYSPHHRDNDTDTSDGGGGDGGGGGD